MNNTRSGEGGKADILVVDDTPSTLRLLTNMLKEQGYRVRPVPSGRLAMNVAESQPPDVILVDISLAEMEGCEACRRFQSDDRFNHIPLIAIIDTDTPVDMELLYSSGVQDHIARPFDPHNVSTRVRGSVELSRLRLLAKRYANDLETLVRDKATEESECRLATLFAVAKLAESREESIGMHLERVQCYCETMAEALRQDPRYRNKIDNAFVVNIYRASVLHDIGKVLVPDRILQKPSKLSESEFTVMSTHTLMACQALRAVADQYPSNAFIQMAEDICRSHHEKWDGTGYPDGLSGGRIPLSARIMAIADVFDALTSSRCYRKAYSPQETREIIFRGAGTHFDPAIVEVFGKLQREFEKIRQDFKDD